MTLGAGSGVLTLGTLGPINPPADRLTLNFERAEEQGFDAIWVPDHLMGWLPSSIMASEPLPNSSRHSPHAYYDPFVVLAQAASVTKRCMLGVGVTDAIRNHPAQIARTLLTLDHLSGGRAILGLGAGEGVNCQPFGLSLDGAARRVREAIEVIRILWTQTDSLADYEGSFFVLHGAQLGLRAHEGSQPQIWVASHGNQMLQVTGELADGWLPHKMPLSLYESKLDAVRSSATAAKRHEDDITPGMGAYVVVDDDHERCHELLNHPLLKFYCLTLGRDLLSIDSHPLGNRFYGLTDLLPHQLSRNQVEDAVAQLPFSVVHEFFLHGTPRDIAEQLKEYWRIGLRHCVLWNVTFLADSSITSQSFRLLATVRELVNEIGERNEGARADPLGCD